MQGVLLHPFQQAKWSLRVPVKPLSWRLLLLKITVLATAIRYKEIIYKLKMELLYHLMQPIQIRKQLMEFRLNG